MKAWSRWCCVAALATALHGIGVSAAEYKRLDGIHRIEKKAQITAPAQLLVKRDGKDTTCASSLSLCASEFGGGCCPDGYQCAQESCYATTRAPMTCLGKAGWHACPLVNGGGCCPDGLICDKGSNCKAPSGSSYTFGCPADYFQCPSSLNYGCCPNGMGCAANQCYSTEVQTVTTRMAVTTTKDGDRTTIISTRTSTFTPTIPTALPSSDNSDEGQKVLKFFPSAVAKAAAEPEQDDGNDNQGLSKGAVGGIVAGAVVFLIIIVAVAWVILRRLNTVAAAVSASKPSSASRSRPPMRHQPTESEIDGVSVDPLMVSPPASVSPGVFRYGRPPTDPSVHSQAPSSFAGGYSAVSPGDTARPQYDMSGNIVGYFDHPVMKPRRTNSNAAQSLPRVSEDSQNTYTHGRQWSNASETSGEHETSMAARVKELEGDPYVPELAGSPPGFIVSPLDETDSSFSSIQPLNISRKKSNIMGTSRSDAVAGPSTQLDVVDEETNSFQGRSFRIMGQPTYQAVQGMDEDERQGANPGYYGR